VNRPHQIGSALHGMIGAALRLLLSNSKTVLL
jgi:hypothetical protein